MNFISKLNETLVREKDLFKDYVSMCLKKVMYLEPGHITL